MTNISILYKKLSGLPHIDIDKLIANTPEEDLPKLYKKLIWNIQRGRRIDLNNWIGKSFAEIICELATLTKIDAHSDDPDKDGVKTDSDWRITTDLEFAHEYIKDCEHNNEIFAKFIREIEEDFILVDEDGKNILTTDNIKNV